ncbi:MAG TPA: alpha/beta fold hydrolase [Patescibacteria group bacterium]|nr:alpha/beta fold hydrolase [Patescibacteria group bacterium]
MGGIPAGETFEGTFTFAPHFSSAPGFRMHYVDEGSGEPIILIHGEPTWGYLYRNFIPPLSRRFRVIVPDHMGFGKSETPQDADYTLARHAANLGALIEELDIRDITLVMQDWGGPMGMVLASRYPERIKRFVAMNTTFGTDRNVREPRLTPWFAAIKSMEDSGQLEAVLGNLRHLAGAVMMMLGIQRREVVTDLWLRAYAAPFATFEECKGAIAFPLEGLHLDRIRDTLVAALPGVYKLGQAGTPAMMIEGMQDRAIWPHVALAGFRAFFPRGTVHELEGVGHFIQEDAPEIVVPLIEEFCLRT